MKWARPKLRKVNGTEASAVVQEKESPACTSCSAAKEKFERLLQLINNEK